MRISSFADLTGMERQRLLNSISVNELSFADAGVMEHYLLGPAFEMGNTYLTLWEDEAPTGGVGVVVRDIAAKGEAFLTLLYLFTSDIEVPFARLLQEAYAVIGRSGGVDRNTVVKFGIGAKESRLQALLERTGWHIAYRFLDMVHSLDSSLPVGAAVQFRPLTQDNLMDFLIVHNAAFLESPNGAQLVPEQLEQMRREVRSIQFLQVGYADSTPVAILQVDVPGEIGQIEAIGVAPAFQGRGLGKAAVAQALRVLAEGGALETHLQVAEVNRPAVELYRACGFTVNRVVSTWYCGPTIDSFATAHRG